MSKVSVSEVSVSKVSVSEVSLRSRGWHLVPREGRRDLGPGGGEGYEARPRARGPKIARARRGGGLASWGPKRRRGARARWGKSGGRREERAGQAAAAARQPDQQQQHDQRQASNTPTARARHASRKSCDARPRGLSPHQPWAAGPRGEPRPGAGAAGRPRRPPASLLRAGAAGGRGSRVRQRQYQAPRRLRAAATFKLRTTTRGHTYGWACFRSTITVEQQSTITVDQQSTITVEQQSTITVEQQSTMTVEQQSTMTVSQQGTIIVEQQSTITVEQQSTRTVSQQSTRTV